MSRILPGVAALACFAWGQSLDEGKRAFDAGNYTLAAQKFEQAYQQSHNCEVLFYLGMAQYRMQKPDSAMISFQSAVRCDPKLIPAHLALAEAYGGAGNYGQAILAFTRVLEIEPRNRTALEGSAAIYLRQNMNDKAVPMLETLALVAPRDPRVHADLGAAYFATGNLDDAEKQFREAIGLNAKDSAALLGLANVQIRKSEETEAVAALQKVIALTPKAFEPRFLLGSCYNRMERYADAVKEFQTALELGGNQSEVYYQLARAFGGLGKAEDRRQALAQFAVLSRKAKDDTESRRSALKLMDEAKRLIDAGQLTAATARLEEARQLTPADDRVLFRLAGVQYDLKRYDSARDVIEGAIALSPSEWLYHYLLGLIEMGSKRWQFARKSLEMAAKLNPSAAEVQNALGQTALQEGDRTRAAAGFQKAVELDPKEPAYKLNLESVRPKQ